MNWHPDDDQLLWSLDAELPPRDLARVRSHLENCWSCRVRVEKMQAAISEFVEYRNTVGAVATPPSGSGRRFEHRLDSSLRDSRPSRLGHRARFQRWLPFAAAACLILLAVSGYFRISRTPVVAAAELLRRAESAEPSPGQLVRQTIRVRAGNRSYDRQLVLNSAEATLALSADPLARIFHENALNWDNPLSARSFERWRGSLPTKKDEVRATDDVFSLTTRRPDADAAPNGSIRQVTLQIRSGNYHVVAGTFNIKEATGDQEIEISEIKYEVLPAPSAPASTVAATVQAAPAAHPVAPAIESPPFPSPTELAAAELEIRLELNSAHADLGEQIDIQAGARAVEVTGVVADTGRKQELATALNAIPHVHAALITVEDASRAQSSTAAAVVALGSVSASSPPMEELLRRRFPEREDRESFTRQVLGHSQQALQRAWALRRLARRYTQDEMTLLSADNQTRLSGLIQQHSARATEHVLELARLMRPFVASRAGAAKAPGDSATADWHESAERRFKQSDALDRVCTELFTGSDRGVEELLAEFAALQESLTQGNK